MSRTFRPPCEHHSLPTVTFAAVAACVVMACADSALPTGVPHSAPPAMAANGDGSLVVTSVIGLEPVDQGLNSSAAHGVNDGGQVVGSSEMSAGGEHAAMWLKGKVLDLGVLPGYVDSKAFGISNNNQIVGVSIAPGGIRATKWTVK
jgi:probable HAF family extracellular repeat protein